MPRKHSTVSLYAPTYNMTLTAGSLQSISLNQSPSEYNEILLYFNRYIKPYYVTRFLGDYNAQLELMAFDEQHGPEVETKVRNWKVDTSVSEEDVTFIKVLSDFVYHHVLCIRRAFAILNTNDALTQEISEMQATIDEQDAIIQTGTYNNKRFQTALLCDVKGAISLDLRYWLYIKEHGSPPDGNFDPEKLEKYKYIDSSGNQLTDQDFLQYTGLGIEKTTSDEQQLLPTIFTQPVETGPTLTTEDIINVDVSDNILTPW